MFKFLKVEMNYVNSWNTPYLERINKFKQIVSPFFATQKIIELLMKIYIAIYSSTKLYMRRAGVSSPA